MKALGARLLKPIGRRLPLLYLVSVFAASAAFLVFRPIMAGDTDLWYHLNSGRYIFEHHALPRTSFFSFLSPPRSYDDYYWLFQLVAYGVFRFAGYAGLIALRLAAFAATMLVIGRFLLGKGWRDPSPYGCAVFTLYALLLCQRFLLVRPHIFSLLMIPIFLAVLRGRGGWAAALPLLAALWGNLHGIEAPVACLILASAMAEHFLLAGPLARDPREQRFMAHCAFAMLALFLTPMGYRLFELPFVSVDYIQRMVLESRVPRLCDVFAVNITGGVIGFVTASNLLYGLAALCAAASLSGRRARLGHFLLMAGGAYLLTRANRFRYESALLMLPLIEAHPPFGEGLRASKPVRWALGALLVAVTVLSFRPLYRHRPLWPFSWRNLPHGSVAFLKHIDRGGKIWNNPSPGGYLQFELYPRYLIAADMQTPFLFDDKDLYLARESFMDRRLLALALERHRPDFILAPLAQTGFPGLIKDFKDYSLVFFDDVSALYASRKSMPDVVAAYALQEDPFHTTWRFPPPDPAYRGKKMPEFLGRMMAIDPECQNTRWRAARFCLLKGDFQGELAHAEAMIRAYPENYFGHLVKGNALRHLGRLDEAMASLKEALSRSPGEAEVFSHHEMASIYQARGRFKDAVDILRETDDHFPPDSWLMSISTASAQGNALLARPS